jgi:phosphonate transport system substrate-binding protein
MKKKTMLAALVCIFALSLMTPYQTFAKEPLKIGVAAMISPKQTFKYYQAILDYLGEKIGEPVELVQQPSYAEMDKRLQEEAVQIAFICSGPYIKDKAEFGVELLVAPVSYGQPFYHAYIIVPKDSPNNSLADLQGKAFAFTDPHSNTGKIVPHYMVASRFSKQPEEYFSKVEYSKSHDKSIEMVAKKLVDGASIDSLIYDYAVANDPTYTSMTRIVEKSPAYGIPPIVVTKGVSNELKEKIRNAFLRMHEDPKGKAIISKIMVDKFIVPDDKNYDSVRVMEKWLKENEKEMVTKK